jgi:hypothetical protein
MGLASVAGLLFPSHVYPTEELRESLVANDVVNLAIGVPILLGSMGFARRGKLLGLLFWPGALLYVLYNYVAYAFSMSVSWALLSDLALIAMSAYALIGLVSSIDGAAVQERLAGVVHERLSGGVLVGFGALFLLRVIALIGGALIGQREMPATELAVMIADFLLSPAWAIGGVLLWRRKALGYVAGAGLLFQTSMLFVGVIAFVFLQPLLSGVPFSPIDAIVLAVMGLTCFLPFGLFVRGVVSRTSTA